MAATSRESPSGSSSIRNDHLVLSVTRRGAELSSIRTVADGFEYLWQGDAATWAARSPVLFPIIGRLENGTYDLGDRTYRMSMHGFARDSEFELVQQEGQLLRYRLAESESTLEIYPFRFELLVCYRLDGNRIHVEYLVRNNDRRTLWFSIGGHPGFNCPFGTDGSPEDYMLEFEIREHVGRRIVQDGFLSLRTEPFLEGENVIHPSKILFKRPALVLEGVRSRYVTLKSPKSRRSVTVFFEGSPYLAFWSPAASGSLLCIEPWHGVLPTKGRGRDLRKREGINALLPGRDARFCYSIAINRGG
jgi:galactose mutarotase-like enzyme